MEIYADMVFLINFAMNFFILWIGSKLIHRRISVFWILLGSCASTILYCLVLFLPAFQRYNNFFGSLIILIFGILVSFHPRSAKELIKLVFFCHLSAFMIGGVGMALVFYTDFSGLFGNNIGFSVSAISWKVLLITVSSVYICIKCGISLIQRILLNQQSFCPVTIHMDHTNINVNALVDTGFTLKDPISGGPVIVVELDQLKPLLPQSLAEVFDHQESMSLLVAGCKEPDLTKRIRVLPYSSLGNENGMLLGFRPDKVEVYREGIKVELFQTIIGVYGHCLSKDGTYHALLSPMIFQNNI